MRTSADEGCTSAPVLDAVQQAVQKLQELGASVTPVSIFLTSLRTPFDRIEMLYPSDIDLRLNYTSVMSNILYVYCGFRFHFRYYVNSVQPIMSMCCLKHLLILLGMILFRYADYCTYCSHKHYTIFRSTRKFLYI